MMDLLTTVPAGLEALAAIPLEHGGSLEHWTQAEFFEALSSRIKGVMGMAAFAMIVGVPMFLALQYWSRNYTVPTVVLTLSGGVVISMMPPAVARIGYIIILLGVALGLFGMMWAVIR